MIATPPADPPSRPVGRLHHVALDTTDPLRLARFWSSLLGEPITYRSDDWVVVARDDEHSGLAFQRVPDHRPPVWGDPARPQQLHLDVMVDDLEVAAPVVEALGATRLPSVEGSVWADPAGHPFCLVPRPGWAGPVSG